jgi:hypothetical protein
MNIFVKYFMMFEKYPEEYFFTKNIDRFFHKYQELEIEIDFHFQQKNVYQFVYT